jgi:hypothetical protein
LIAAIIHGHGPAATRRFGVVERSAHRRDQPGGTPMRFIAPASAADQLRLLVIFELVEDWRTPDGPVDPSTANHSKVSRCRLRRSTQVSSSAANTQAIRQPPTAARRCPPAFGGDPASLPQLHEDGIQMTLLVADERRFVDENQQWSDVERGYSAIQSTKPQTLGYGLNDSPAGLAAWIVEKWRSWSDSGGDVDAHLSRDFLLTVVTLYWVTQTITSSMRDYVDNRWFGAPIGPHDFVTVPTAVANFANEFVAEGEPPREWFERLYNVRQWTPMRRGGHFAAAEEPELLARDIAMFFANLSNGG